MQELQVLYDLPKSGPAADAGSAEIDQQHVYELGNSQGTLCPFTCVPIPLQNTHEPC